MSSSSITSSADKRGLRSALGVSLLIHLGVFVVLNAALLPASTRSGIRSNRVEVSLPKLTIQPNASLHDTPVVKAHAIRTAVKSPSNNVTSPARFLVDPNLDELQDIPVFVGGKVKFRLHVSIIGTVSTVEILESDPIPQALLSGLQDKLKRAKLKPATTSGESVASTLDIAVKFEDLEILNR